MKSDAKSWHLQSLVSESFRRIIALPLRMAVLVLASGVMFPTVLVAELVTLEDIADFRRVEMWHGRGIVVVDDVPSVDRPLLRSACTQMSSHHGIAAIGGIREPQTYALVTYPGVGIRLAGLEDNTWRMWFPDSPVPVGGLAAGSELTERVGLLEGDPIRLDGFPSQTFETEMIISGRRPFAQGEGWLLQPMSILDPIDQCWIEFSEPVEQQHIQHVAAAVANLSEYEVNSLIRANDLTRNSTREFAERWTKWGLLASSMVVALMYLLLLQSRKGEQAVYVTAGLSRTEDYLMSIIEVATVVVVPGAAISAIVVSLHSSGGHANNPLVHKLAVESQLLAFTATLVLLPLLSALRRHTSTLEDLKSQ